MAAAFGLDLPTNDSAPAAPVVDRQQWWADVQLGVSALLTEAAHPAATQRLAG